jgi:phage-related protein
LWAFANGGYPGQEYFLALPDGVRAKAERLLRRMADIGRITNPDLFRPEGDGIYCFKPYGHRFACFFDGLDVVVTHGFKKQGQKMPKNEFTRAASVRRQYLER